MLSALDVICFHELFELTIEILEIVQVKVHSICTSKADKNVIKSFFKFKFAHPLFLLNPVEWCHRSKLLVCLALGFGGTRMLDIDVLKNHIVLLHD